MKLRHKIAALTALPVFFLQASLTMSCTAAKIDSTEASVLSEETTAFYENWKDKYLVQDTYVSDETQYYVWYSEEKIQQRKQRFCPCYCIRSSRLRNADNGQYG